MHGGWGRATAQPRWGPMRRVLKELNVEPPRDRRPCSRGHPAGMTAGSPGEAGTPAFTAASLPAAEGWEHPQGPPQEEDPPDGAQPHGRLPLGPKRKSQHRPRRGRTWRTWRPVKRAGHRTHTSRGTPVTGGPPGGLTHRDRKAVGPGLGEGPGESLRGQSSHWEDGKPRR